MITDEQIENAERLKEEIVSEVYAVIERTLESVDKDTADFTRELLNDHYWTM